MLEPGDARVRREDGARLIAGQVVRRPPGRVQEQLLAAQGATAAMSVIPVGR